MSVLKPTELLVQPDSGEVLLVPSSNFSYKTIPENTCMRVPEYQEMILYDKIIIQGKLILKGDLAFVR